MKTKFSDLTTKEAILVLTEIGDVSSAEALSSLLKGEPDLESTTLADLPESDLIRPFGWRGAEHTYGYIVEDGGTEDFLDIKFATTITPDIELKGKPINIKLGSLYTIDYPGGYLGGRPRHNVLLHFKCKHAKENSNETTLIEFEQKFKTREGEGAGNLGDFIFLGVRVPSNGLQFEVQTVNINNDEDETALKILESDTIRNGLDVFNSTFATLAPFTKMAQGVLGLLLNNNKNKIVQQFTIGFDFDSRSVEIAKLKLGTYVVAQAKKDALPWNEWVYQRSTGLIKNRRDPNVRLPANHLTFNILNYTPE